MVVLPELGFPTIAKVLTKTFQKNPVSLPASDGDLRVKYSNYEGISQRRHPYQLHLVAFEEPKFHEADLSVQGHVKSDNDTLFANLEVPQLGFHECSI